MSPTDEKTFPVTTIKWQMTKMDEKGTRKRNIYIYKNVTASCTALCSGT
jgi:hypothetical protein